MRCGLDTAPAAVTTRRSSVPDRSMASSTPPGITAMESCWRPITADSHRAPASLDGVVDAAIRPFGIDRFGSLAAAAE